MPLLRLSLRVPVRRRRPVPDRLLLALLRRQGQGQEGGHAAAAAGCDPDDAADRGSHHGHGALIGSRGGGCW